MKQIILAAFVVMIITSCGTTKKAISSHQAKSDSSVEHSLSKQGVSSTENSSVNQKDSSFNNDVVIEFDTPYLPGNYNPAKLQSIGENTADHITGISETTAEFRKRFQRDAVQEAVDLAGPVDKPIKKKQSFNYNIGGTPISSDVPIKSATLHQGGKVTDLTVRNEIKKDSGQLLENDKTHVVVEKKDTDKKVTRSGWPWWIWLMVILTTAFTYLSFAYKKSWFPFGHFLWAEEEQNFNNRS